MTILWVSMDIGKCISSEFVGMEMGLLMTLGCLRLIWSIHPMCYSIGYRHTSEDALSMLVFCCLGSFINCLLTVNVLSILVQGSFKDLVFWGLESLWVGHRLH